MDKWTIVRTVAFALAWINTILAKYGLQPIPVLDEETIALGLALVASIWAWFKNNYITAKGRKQKQALERNGLK